MFENLRDALRDAIANFKYEVGRDDVPVTVDRLLLAMQNELADARVLIESLDQQIAQATIQVGRDRDEESTCRRRAQMAARVGDEETARIALEYAVRYERRRLVMERKVVALQEERSIRIVELTEMTERIEEARSKRDTLAAAAEGSDDDRAVRAADDLFDELDQMASAMDPSVRADRRRTMDDLEREF